MKGSEFQHPFHSSISCELLRLFTYCFVLFIPSQYNVKYVCMRAKSLQLCPTLCDPMDCSPPGSSVHGILQARILEWVAMPSSKGSSQPGHCTCHLSVSCISIFLIPGWSNVQLKLRSPALRSGGTAITATRRAFVTAAWQTCLFSPSCYAFGSSCWHWRPRDWLWHLAAGTVLLAQMT